MIFALGADLAVRALPVVVDDVLKQFQGQADAGGMAGAVTLGAMQQFLRLAQFVAQSIAQTVLALDPRDLRVCGRKKNHTWFSGDKSFATRLG